MEENVQALNLFLSVGSAFVPDRSGASYLSWIKAKYAETAHSDIEDANYEVEWRKEYEANMAGDNEAPKLAPDICIENGDEINDIALGPGSTPLTGEMFFHKTVKVDNFYVDGESEDEVDVSGYLPSGTVNITLDSPQEEAQLRVTAEDTQLQDLDDCDEDGNPFEPPAPHVTHGTDNQTGREGDGIETLVFSDDDSVADPEFIDTLNFRDPDSETENERLEPKSTGLRIPPCHTADVLAALAEFRRMGGARYGGVSDAQLLAELNRTDAKTANAVESGAAPEVGVEEKQRWYEDVEPFSVVDSDDERNCL